MNRRSRSSSVSFHGTYCRKFSEAGGNLPNGFEWERRKDLVIREYDLVYIHGSGKRYRGIGKGFSEGDHTGRLGTRREGLGETTMNLEWLIFINLSVRVT